MSKKKHGGKRAGAGRPRSAVRKPAKARAGKYVYFTADTIEKAREFKRKMSEAE